MLLDEVENKEAPRDGMKRAIAVGELLLEQMAVVDDLEAKLKTAKDAVKKTTEDTLPELMKELGLKNFSLESGWGMTLEEKVQCGITEARREAAHRWLIDNGYGGLIKTEVVVPFDRGDQEQATALVETLRNDQHLADVNVREAVNAATLKSWVRERMEAGTALPLDLFGVFSYNIVKVTPPKKKR